MAQSAGYTFEPSTVSVPGGVTRIRDVAGYGVDGTLVGSVALTSTAKYGQALNCTGGAMQANPVAASYPLNTDGGMSLFCWVKLNDNTSAVRVIASASSGGSLAWSLQASNASGFVSMTIAGTEFATTTSIRDGAWHAITMVYDKVSATKTVKIDIDGTLALNTTATPALAYSGTTVVEVGRNALTGTTPLNGIVDDFRWWNDPVETSFWPNLRAAEQRDFLLGVYPFDGDGVDRSVYGNDLTVHGTATYPSTVQYDRGLKGNGTNPAATRDVMWGSLDRLTTVGWLTLDAAPATAQPALTITDTSNAIKGQLVVNPDRTLTATWNTLDGTFSVTSGIAMTVGTPYRLSLSMNPTYVDIQLGAQDGASGAWQTTVGGGTPHLTPQVADLNRLYVAGGPTGAAAVTWDYLTFIANFISAETLVRYWSGAAVPGPQAPPAPVARYNFDEGSGTTAADTSGNGNTLTLMANGTWVTGSSGSGSALRAPATGSMAAASTTSLTGWGASPRGWSASAWMKFDTPGSGARMLVMRTATGEVAQIGFLSGRLWVRLYNATGGATGILNPAAAGISANTWYHVVATLDRYTLRLYRNGVLVFTEYARFINVDLDDALPVPTRLWVGGDNADAGVGAVDQLRLYNQPLSDANVAWLYGEGAAAATGTATGGFNFAGTAAGVAPVLQVSATAPFTLALGATAVRVERERATAPFSLALTAAAVRVEREVAGASFALSLSASAAASAAGGTASRTAPFALTLAATAAAQGGGSVPARTAPFALNLGATAARVERELTRALFTAALTASASATGSGGVASATAPFALQLVATAHAVNPSQARDITLTGRLLPRPWKGALL